MWIPRNLSSRLQSSIEQRPVVLITGARQTGKSSLLQHQLPQAVYATLDRPLVATAAKESPSRWLDSLEAEGSENIVIDEVQYAPDLFRELKPRVDSNRVAGRWLLTGSQRFELMQGVGESLAGRIRILHLETLSAAEVRNADMPTADFLWRGGYPELWKTPELSARDFFDDYLQTYLERDLHAVIDVANLLDFQRFISSCALLAGQLLNYSRLSRDVGVSDNTCRRWLAALQTAGLISLLPPWHSNLGKRLVRSPKLYFNDQGLLCYLLNIRNEQRWHEHPAKGALWENLVFGELVKQRQLRPGRDLFFYRDQNGVEIDFVIEGENGLELIEAKAAERPPARVGFNKVTKLLKRAPAQCVLACMMLEERPLPMAGYTVLNPMRHDC